MSSNWGGSFFPKPFPAFTNTALGTCNVGMSNVVFTYPALPSQSVMTQAFLFLANQFSNLWCLKAVRSTVPALPPTMTSTTPDTPRPNVKIKPH